MVLREMNIEPLIRLLPSSATDDGDLLRDVTELTNRVYADAEAGMWQPGTPRTNSEEITDAIGAGQIVVACLDGRVVGVVRTSAADGTGWLGMLAVHPDYRGAGIGRRLVDTSESTAAADGAKEMQIEVLTPIDGSNSSKIELDRWYKRLGYEHTGDDDLAKHHAALSDLLAIPCVLKVYRKPLTP